MVGLVPIEKDVISMVLLVNMHLITLTFFPCDLAGYRAIQWIIGTNGTIGTNRKAHHSNGSIGVKQVRFYTK